MPPWLGPLLVLIILALIPFALMLAAGLTVLAVGFSIFRLFLPSRNRPLLGHPTSKTPERIMGESDAMTIDAEYEIKDEHGKN